MNNSEDTTKKLSNQTPDAPDTAPLLRELLANFREEREANQAFRTQVTAQLDGVLQRLSALEEAQARSENFESDARKRFLSDDAFQQAVLQRLSAIESEQRLNRREIRNLFAKFGN